MTLSTATHDTFVIERTYDSPVASVFRAWADPDRKARWFAGSADALGHGYELDFKVGGCEVNRGGPPGGPVYTYSAQFRGRVSDPDHIEPFPSWLCFTELQYVGGLGELTGAPGRQP